MKTPRKNKTRKRRDTKVKLKSPKPITKEGELKEEVKFISKTRQAQKQVKAQLMLNNVMKIPIVRD